MNSLRVTAIIPARYGSTRFPGKPLVNLCGKPMIQWVIEGAQTSSKISELFVATDSVDIAKKAEEFGVRAIMTSEKCQTGSDRIFQALQILKKENKYFDIVVNIQGDEPLITNLYIDPIINAFAENSDLDMATLSHLITAEEILNLNSVKVLLNKKSEAIYFSRLPIPFSREKFAQDSFAASVQKHIGIYGYKIDFLEKFCQEPQSLIEKAESLEQLRALHLGAKIKVIPVSEAIQGIDTPDDIKVFEKKYFAKQSKV